MNRVLSVHGNEQEWYIDSCVKPFNFVLSDM